MTSTLFKPTFLYIKRHPITGKVYFGKTVQNPEIYIGQGSRWRNHIKTHGAKYVENLWYCLYTDEDELKKFSMMYSEIFRICDSNSEYLNLKPENGLDGATPGYATYKDSDGINYYLHYADPKIARDNLCGFMSGYKMSEDTKETMRRAKDSYRKITLHFMTFERTVNINSDDMSILIDHGWTPYMQQERLDAKKEKAKLGAKKAMIGKNRFYYQDGTYYGMLEESDPIVSAFNLVHIRSDKQKAQASEQARKNAQNEEMQLRKGKTMSTRKWFHDPITKKNKRLLTCPDGWKEGRSEQETSNKGRETWNDGIRSYMIKSGEVPDPSWVRGMAPRKKK